MAKHSGLKEISSTAISPFEEIPLDASNCKTYLQIVDVETINQILHYVHAIVTIFFTITYILCQVEQLLHSTKYRYYFCKTTTIGWCYFHMVLFQPKTVREVRYV